MEFNHYEYYGIFISNSTINSQIIFQWNCLFWLSSARRHFVARFSSSPEVLRRARAAPAPNLANC